MLENWSLRTARSELAFEYALEVKKNEQFTTSSTQDTALSVCSTMLTALASLPSPTLQLKQSLSPLQTNLESIFEQIYTVIAQGPELVFPVRKWVLPLNHVNF